LNTKTRTTAVHPALGENRRLTFYAALFGVETTVFDRAAPFDDRKVKYKERVLPGAFDDTLAKPVFDVIATIDHDEARAFARVSAGELLLQPDPHGLFCSCYLPDTELGDHVLKEVKAGRLVGTSFQMLPVKERWETDGVLPACDVEPGVRGRRLRRRQRPRPGRGPQVGAGGRGPEQPRRCGRG
jgi:HK97 family phage prohead protease